MANNERLIPLCGPTPSSSSWLLCLVFACSALMAGCASTSTPQATPTAATPQDAKEALMSEVMAAEMAFKEERLDAAAEGYVGAAMRSPDVQIADRATRIAVFAKRYELAQKAAKRWLELDPNALLARQALASAAIHEGNEAAALEQLQRLLDGTQPARERWQLVGQALVGHDASLLAKRLFTRLLEDPNAGTELDSRLAQSQLAAVLKMPERALVLADLAVNENPKSERALIFRGQMKLELEQIDAGLADYARASALLPDDRALKMGYAALLSKYQRAADADRVLAALPQDLEVLLTRAAYADEAGNRAAALGFYRQLVALKVDNRAEHAFALGQLAETLKLNDEALRWYGQVDLGENVGEARLRQAVVLNASERSKEALALLARLQTESEDPQIIEGAYLFEAEMANQKNDDRTEFATLDRGLAALSNSPRLLYARALKLVEAKRLDDAERDFRRLIGLDPEAAYALNALGYTLADETTRYDEAHTYISRALKLTPDEPAVLDSMGWVLFKQGKLEQSQAYLARAYALSKDAEIAAHYGEVLIANGKIDDGTKLLQDAFKANPKHDRLKNTMRRLGVQ